MRASILEPESRSHYQVFDRARDQHLPWYRFRFHTGPNMHGNPTYVVAKQFAFTGVQAHPVHMFLNNDKHQ